MMLSTLGGFLIGVLGVLLPPTMFWAEFEIGSVADPSKELPNVWPPVSGEGSVGGQHCIRMLGSLLRGLGKDSSSFHRGEQCSWLARSAAVRVSDPS